MKNLTVIPEEARIQPYIKKKIFIPPGNRCCTTHILKNGIYEEDSTLLDKIGEFSLSEKQIQIFTGFSWENLLEIKDLMTSLRNSQFRNILKV